MARILDITPEEYHWLPSLSSSLAKILVDRSPAYAKEDRGKTPSAAAPLFNPHDEAVHRACLASEAVKS